MRDKPLFCSFVICAVLLLLPPPRCEMEGCHIVEVVALGKADGKFSRAVAQLAVGIYFGCVPYGLAGIYVADHCGG